MVENDLEILPLCCQKRLADYYVEGMVHLHDYISISREPAH